MSTERRGGALLAVLWLSAALSAIAWAVASGVRSEIRHAETSLDAVRAHYLATGAVDRAITYILFGPGVRTPLGGPRYWEPGQPFLRFAFPAGEAFVEIIPASSRLNLNAAPTAELERLMLALGVAPDRARQLALAIADWRSPAPGGIGLLDAQYLQLGPSFRPPHASFQQIEELLLVRGITPELYYGRFERTPQGELAARSGLRDCLTLYSPPAALDLNSVDPAVMFAVGVPAQAAEVVIQTRRLGPVRNEQLARLTPLLGPAAGRFRVGGEGIFLLRATARPRLADGRLSEVRRSAEATVRLLDQRQHSEAYSILAWDERPAVYSTTFEPWPR